MREFRKKIALVLAIVFILSTCNIQNNVYANDEDNDELVTETLHNNTMDSLEAYETEDSDDKMTDVLSSQFDQQRKYTAASNKYLAVSNAAVNKIYSVLLSGTKTEVDVSGYGLTTSHIEDAWILALNEDRILYNTYYSDLTINYLHYTDG